MKSWNDRRLPYGTDSLLKSISEQMLQAGKEPSTSREKTVLTIEKGNNQATPSLRQGLIEARNKGERV